MIKGLKCMDELPEGWEVKRLAYLGEFRKGRGIARDNITPEGVPAILYGDIYTQYDVKTDRLVKFTTPEVAAGAEPIQYGDLLLTGSGETKEDIGRCVAYIGKEQAYAGGDVIIFRQNQVNSLFLSYALNSSPSVAQKTQMGKGEIIVHIYSSDLRNLVVALPPLTIQRAIADYLDAETQRIDELIAAKRSMLALLEKKRAALVSQAVTKGLDPKAKMKDSGLEWLGEIPEHWGVMRLGYLFSMQGGSTPSKANEDFWKGTIPWATPKDIKRPVLHDTIDHVADEVLTETGLSMIEPPVVLIVVRGMILARRIPTALTAVPMTINQDMKALTPNATLITANYLKLVFDGVQSAMAPLIEEAGHGTKVLRTDLLTSFKIPLPSLQHQQAILDGLEDYNKSSLLLEKELNASITLLVSRRSALITAAVTGQVGVAELVKA